MKSSFTIVSPENEVIKVHNIYCIGRNYSAHIKELNNDRPDAPFFFQKSLPSLNTSSLIKLPYGRDIHHELEIIIFINKDCDSLSMEDASKFIGGYGLGLDLTDRVMQNEFKSKQLPWLLAKSFFGSAVISKFQSEPIIEPFWLEINGINKQTGKLEEMIYTIPEQIAYLSSKIPLMRGDILFTGTPKGTGPISQGDKLTFGVGGKMFKSLAVH